MAELVIGTFELVQVAVQRRSDGDTVTATLSVPPAEPRMPLVPGVMVPQIMLQSLPVQTPPVANLVIGTQYEVVLREVAAAVPPTEKIRPR